MPATAQTSSAASPEVRLEIPTRELGDAKVPYDVLKFIPQESAEHYHLAPLSVVDGVLEIGMLDPDNRISGRGQRALRKAGIRTDLFPSDLMAEVEDLNRDFVRDRESESSTGEDGLADAILSLARRVKQEQPNAVFLESALSEELKEAPERIARAMDILVSRGRAKHAGFVGTWYVYA